MKILLVGINGFIGRELAKHLSNSHDVSGFSTRDLLASECHDSYRLKHERLADMTELAHLDVITILSFHSGRNLNLFNFLDVITSEKRKADLLFSVLENCSAKKIVLISSEYVTNLGRSADNRRMPFTLNQRLYIYLKRVIERRFIEFSRNCKKAGGVEIIRLPLVPHPKARNKSRFLFKLYKLGIPIYDFTNLMRVKSFVPIQFLASMVTNIDDKGQGSRPKIMNFSGNGVFPLRRVISENGEIDSLKIFGPYRGLDHILIPLLSVRRLKVYTGCPKRIIDFSMAAMLFLPSVLILLMLWLPHRLLLGPPFIHWSSRAGLYGKLFRMPKIRTMSVDTPQIETERLPSKNIDKITPFASLLRRMSLDELPQIYSVLMGHMSFVGPRPALFNQSRLIGLRGLRGVNNFRPGLTGLAQVLGRDLMPLEEKIVYDKIYCENISLMTDLKIILLTFTSVFRASGVRH